MINLIPVYVDFEIQLWDIYVNEEWIGSRRKFDWAIEAGQYYANKINNSLV